MNLCESLVDDGDLRTGKTIIRTQPTTPHHLQPKRVEVAVAHPQRSGARKHLTGVATATVDLHRLRPSPAERWRSGERTRLDRGDTPKPILELLVQLPTGLGLGILGQGEIQLHGEQPRCLEAGIHRGKLEEAAHHEPRPGQ